jgi:homoaconitate hydratase
MSQTLVEKIAQNYAVGLPAGQSVHAGDFLSVRPRHCMTHDNTDAVIPKFKSIGATRIHDPRQPVFCLDHDIQNRSEENLGKYTKIEQFARTHGVDFYPAGRGIGHQIMLEEGYVVPGAFVVASDSHSNIYGALGALGTPVVRTDAAAIWSTGRTWWQVPDVVQVHLTGRLRPGVTGKDVIITLIGAFNKDEVLNCCLEFAGPGVAALAIEERMTIANMTTEWGALAAVFPCDDVTRAYLLARAQHFAARGDAQPRLTPARVDEIVAQAPHADADAFYAKVLEFDLGAVVPYVAGPNEVKAIASATALEAKNVRIDKAFLMSCVNGREQDFAAAAAVLKGRQIAPHVKLYLAAASSEIEQAARARGDWQTLLAAGATALPAGCGACIGLGAGVLGDGEVGISATNRNFDGRMGSRKSQVYLASPAVVAASAAAGRIASPPATHDLPAGALASAGRIRVHQRPATAAARVEILPGFPQQVLGELLLTPKDNMNTDGIYGKEFTYKTLPPEEMAKVAMANYDPEFQNLARPGDILVGGYNFGSGSSREQAATALKFRGLQLIIAGSFSQTYSRNAYNNGFICIECPRLVDDLRAALKGNAARTIRSGWQATVDFTRAALTVRTSGGERQYAFPSLGPVAQELVVHGGFEAVIRKQLG